MVVVLQPVAFTESLTDIVPAPEVFHKTVTLLVPAPAVKVPPETFQT